MPTYTQRNYIMIKHKSTCIIRYLKSEILIHKRSVETFYKEVTKMHISCKHLILVGNKKDFEREIIVLLSSLSLCHFCQVKKDLSVDISNLVPHQLTPSYAMSGTHVSDPLPTLYVSFLVVFQRETKSTLWWYGPNRVNKKVTSSNYNRNYV